MVKHLKGTNKERKAFLASLFFSLDYHSLLPLVVMMFQKYREVCPDKLELLKGRFNKEWNVSAAIKLYFCIGNCFPSRTVTYSITAKVSGKSHCQKSTVIRELFP